ncbi:hypothetical protein [Halobacterium sp. KA-6]|uniref:hypothetical protein n=1 Tax=Halobacterium sp. KA-6 TaxID=2896368 RepID=UPI001E4115EC|nr:hypothetical protein [Halobacterium sp. KA-6]MCD2203231.1 hypothetical protein [Halobacterium sp. KA-6]
MERRRFLALSGSGIATLSGCLDRESATKGADGTGSDGGTKTTAEGPTATVANFDFPEGTGEGGVSDVERLSEQVLDNVETTSFSLDYAAETTDDDSYEVNETARYDPESAEGLTRVQGASGEQSVNYAIYQSGSMVYMAEQVDGNPEYSTYDLSTSENRFKRRTALDSAREDVEFIDSFTYAVDGVTVRDGSATAVLTITGSVEGGDAWLSDPNGTVYLNEAAWPVEFHWNGTSSTGSLEGNGEFSDIGSTTIEKPDWVADAKGS